MKGKNKLIAILFALVAFMASGVAFSFKSSTPQIVYAEVTSIPGFSAEVEGGVIFSAERVYFAVEEDGQGNAYSNSSIRSKALSYNGYNFNAISTNEGVQYFADYKLYRPTDLKDYSHKDVINDGDYLLVDDNAVYASYEGATIKQGVMVTMGGYFYDNQTIKTNAPQVWVDISNTGTIDAGELYNWIDYDGDGEIDIMDGEVKDLDPLHYDKTISKIDYGAGMEFVTAQATLDGKPITLPNARTYNSRYNDFTWFITPGDATEGHYEITLSYMINGEDKPLYKFEFYLLLQSSYEEQQILNGFAYESKPTMNNAMAKSTSTSTDLKYSFFSGLTTEYPTITFDYARYDLTYTHVSGDVQKTIKLDYDERNNQLILSTQIYNDVYQDVYPINTLYKQTSIVTLMFVDSGKYDFNFDYIYRYGDVKKVIPETQIDYAKISLDIYGYQLKYSKAGYTSADMLYLEIYQNGTMFILVNGFTDEGLASGKHSADKTDLGVKYSLITSDEYKTGVIKLDDIQTGGIEGSFNSTEDAINQIDFPKTDMGLWLTLNDNYNLDQSFYCINTAPITSDYVSAVGASSDYINRKDFNKVTTFTTPGYYFVQVSYQYKDENNESKNKIQYFAFQITSVTPTVELYKTREDVYTSEIEYNNFYAHEYTNQNVYANWKETEVFESKIKGKLYFAKGKYISENDLKAVADGANSSNITYNNYEKYTLIKDNGSYLLVLEVGGSLTKTYTYFTIDKENISGLQVYEVATGSVDNKAIYSIKRDENLNYITHTSKGIIDSDFTLSWANKASGANIYASYQFTPFVKKYTSNALSNTIISQTASQTYKYILNEYGVSATSKSISVQKPIALNVALDVNNVLTEQGIYDFTLTDEAGNELKYIVIIDRTEGVVNSTYGEDKTTYISGEMVADYVELEWGTHKAINLDGVSQENNKTIFDLMNGSKIDKYYGEVGNNFNNITNLFMSTGGYNLFVVKNNYTNIKLLPYDSVDNYYRVNSNGVLQVIRANGGIVSGGDEFANRVFENITNAGIKINIDELNGDSYLREYRIDVVGASHIGQGDSGNPFIVRITPDKAMGAVYSASSEGSEFDREVKAHGETTKYVGDNNELYLKEYYDAQASDDGVFVFEWTVPSDTDNFKVTDVRYDYYQLMDQTALDRLNNKTAGEIKAEYMYYPYKWISTTDILKTSDEGDEEVSLYNRTTRAGTDIYRSNVINVGYESYYDENGTLKNSKVTQTGLYIITRTIAINDGGESQISEFSYAFFVDRNAIVAYSLSSVKIVGQFIHVTMPNSDNEVHYSNFTKQGLAKKEQVYINGNKQEKISYTVYLETNKLPAQIKVPTGKYVTGDVNGVDNSSIKATSYQNLKLKLSVYFKDTYGVLPGVNSGAFIKLMNNVVANNDGYIDLKFSNIENPALLTEFKNSRIHNEDGSLSLPGEYIFVISDTVGLKLENFEITDYNKFTFGIKLINQEPLTDVYTYAQIGDNYSDKIYASDDKTLYTNQEFVDFNIAKEELQSYDAQLDINSVEVYRTNKNGQRALWLGIIKNPNGEGVIANTSGIIKDNSRILIDDDKYTIKLDTGLKIDDATGQIESYEEYVYQIYIKYILVNSGESYYTYRDYGESGSFVTNAFYMSTYTVYIDRSPNSSNLESLMGTQGNFFTDYQRYVSEQEDINFDEDVNTVYAYRNSIPAQDYYALVNDLYYQLVGKSQTNTEVKVEPAMYALNVDYTTTLNMDELSRVYYRQLMFDSQIGTDTKMSLLPVFKDYSSVGYHSFNENLPIYQVVVHTDLEVKEGEYYYHKILGLDKNNLENDYNNKYGGYYEIIEKDKAGNYTQYIIYFAPKTATDINIDIYGKNISRINNVAQDSETTITINSKNTTQTTFIGIDKVDNLSGLVHEIGIGSKRYTQYYGNINIYNSSREKVREIYTNSVSKHAVYDVNGVKQTGIESDIYETIKNQGNYIIEYVDVYGNKYSTIINNYTSDEHQLNIANLQLKTDYDGQQYITISGVNSQIDGNTYWYVTEVLVEYGNTTIIYKVQSHKNGITTLEGESIDNNVSLVAPDRLNLAKDNIYLITLTDVANEKYSVMLSTGKDYGYKLFTPDNVYMQNNVVYSASEIELSYNTNFYNVKVEVYLNDSTTPETSNNDYYTDLPSNNYNTLTLKPDAVVNPADHYGSLRRFKVSLCRNDASNEVIQVYEIWIDTRATTFRIENLNKVDKIEFVKSTLHNSQSDYNIIDLKDNMFYTNLISETVNITWTRLTSNYFTYNYDLYEFTSKDEYNKLLINSTTTKYQFAPKDSNTGKYILKITIQGKDGTWIASKVYGIYMSTTITGLYEVKDGNGEVYDYSVITNLSEVMASIGGNESAMALALNLSVNDMKKIFNGFGAKTAIPMYIANKQLMLHSNADNGVRADCYSPSSSSYTTIKFYHIYRSNYRTFAVIMEVYDNSFDKGDILSTLSFITKSEQDGESLLTGGTAKTIYDANAEFYKLSFNSYNRNTSLSALERHNKIIIDVYYDGEFAKRIVGGYGELTSIEFKNGGSYKLSIRDMAGNIQYFRTTASYSDTFTLIVMKDLLYKINNCAPIQYAYYDKPVTLEINRHNEATGKNNYDINSIKLSAILNGNKYTGYDHPAESSIYVFKEYGTYLITITANLLGTSTSVQSRLVFTILNPNEAHTALDFTSIYSYNIISVFSISETAEKDVTDKFMDLLQDKSNTGVVNVYNKLVTYERLTELFGTATQGKMKFRVLYQADDDDLLPPRNAEFSFTLNDETATINASIKPGEKTTKPVILKFNAANIYDQIGDCNLVVNGKVVLRIDQNSENRVTEIKVEEVGQYYVQLVGDSGNIAHSFNFTIKEPLNMVSIILIVIVVAIVVALVGTFIWLRTRMKVR